MKMTRFVLVSLVCSMQCAGEDLRTEEIEFVSHGATLSGSIVVPASDIHAAVVFVHGSGKQARNLHWAERFAREGIAALVYDKRGAGKSGGEYEGNQSVSEKNISLLADDEFSGQRHRFGSKPGKTVDLWTLDFQRQRPQYPGGFVDRQTAKTATRRPSLRLRFVLWSRAQQYGSDFLHRHRLDQTIVKVMAPAVRLRHRLPASP